MIRRSRREIERAIEDLDRCTPTSTPDERELSEVEKHAIRVAARCRRNSPDLDSLSEAAHALLEEALEGAPADGLNDLTVGDVDAAADRLGIERGGQV